MRARPSRWLTSVMTGSVTHPDYDQHSGDEPDPYRFGPDPGLSYHCLAPNCQWKAIGGALALEHFQRTQHAIGLVHVPQAGAVLGRED